MGKVSKVSSGEVSVRGILDTYNKFRKNIQETRRNKQKHVSGIKLHYAVPMHMEKKYYLNPDFLDYQNRSNRNQIACVLFTAEVYGVLT